MTKRLRSCRGRLRDDGAKGDHRGREAKIRDKRVPAGHKHAIPRGSAVARLHGGFPLRYNFPLPPRYPSHFG